MMRKFYPRRRLTKVVAFLFFLVGLAWSPIAWAQQELAFSTLAGLAGTSGSSNGTGATARFNGPAGVAVDSAGNVYVADRDNHIIRKVTPAGVVSTLAGLAGNVGSTDGTNGAARFNGPSGVAVDSEGNVYVADTSNHTIRKVTPAGVVTTMVGSAGETGSDNGTTSVARFNGPSGVAVDSLGNLYVADTSNHTIRRVTPGGVVSTLAGLAGNAGSTDTPARFLRPAGLAVDGVGNVYVADQNNHTIRKVSPAGVVTTLAGLAGNVGSTDGLDSAARFNLPSGVAVDGAGNLYVVDQNNFTIRKLTPAGVVTTLAGLAGSAGSTEGTGRAARFTSPLGVAVDSAGNVYVADAGNHTIRKSTTPEVYTIAHLAGPLGGNGSSDGKGSAARFTSPSGVAVDSAGNVYVADSGNHTIRKVTPDGVMSTLAGLAGTSGSSNGTGSSARFNGPSGVAVDSAGNVYVADRNNHTIRLVTPGGVVSTLAGLAGSSGATDGAGSAARFYGPVGVAVDSGGKVYVADAGNHTIRKVTPDGVVSTLAGSAGSSGFANGTGSLARFNFPTGVAVDSAGIVYVVDLRNSSLRKVTPAGVVSFLRGGLNYPGGVAVDSGGKVYVPNYHNILQVTPSGVVNTLAGLEGNAGSIDGTGSAARFNFPSGMAVDILGNVYVADFGNSTLRKITPGGAVSTLAGLAADSGSTDGATSAARFTTPWGLAVDSAGNVYVADTGNSTVRKVTPTGVAITLAGLAGSYGYADGSGSAALFYGPSSVAVDSVGNVYVAEEGNQTIRKVTPGGVVSTLAGLAGISGSTDGTGSAARFSGPTGLAVDKAGNVYVADWGNNRIRKVTPAGDVTTLAGSGDNGSADGTGSAAQFNFPYGVALDKAGNVYVGDQFNHTIRKVTSAGVVTTLAGLAEGIGSADGTSSAARFSRPSGLAVDNAGNVYVADEYNNTIRKVTPDGVVSTVAGLATILGSEDGTGTAARFSHPTGVAVDNSGNLYVADTDNNAIRIGTPFRALGNIILPTAGTATTNLASNLTLVKAPTWFPLEGAYLDSNVIPPNLPVLYALNPYETNLLLSVTWYDQQTNGIVRYYWVEGHPARQAYLGQDIPLPAGTDPSRTPAGPDTLPPGLAYWHQPSGKLYAKAPLSFSVNWKGTNNNPLPVQVKASWPGANRFQVHVAGSPAVDLSGGAASSSAQLFYQEPGGDVSSEDVQSLGRYANTAPVRSFLLLAPGPSPDTTNIYFQLIQTVAWSDTNYLTDQVAATVGSPILPQAGWHNPNFGGPYVFNALSRYNAHTNYHRREIRTGPIIPVNRDAKNTTSDDMVVVYYEQGLKLFDPLSGQTTSSNIGWPYKPVRYDCQWPSNPERIVIASQLGGSLLGLSDPQLYVQNDPTKAGYNPNDEHALFLNGRGREPQLRLDRTNVVVVEGGMTTAELSISSSQAPVADVLVSLASSRLGAPELTASFSSTGVVSETTFTTANWATPQTIYFLGRTNEDMAENINGTNVVTVRASGGLFDQKMIAVQEADTNRLQLVVEALSLSVPEGSSRSFGVRLTQPPPDEVTVNVIRESGDTDISAQPAQLTFTTADWKVLQPVFVDASSDADSTDGQAVLRLTATGGLAASVTVLVTEADGDLPPVAVFALRDDLGDRPGTASPEYSEPYVLVTHTNAQGPAMKVYRVVAEEAPYFFNFTGVAGRQVQPPYPVSQFQGWEPNTYATNTTVAWQDRKKFWWARAAGSDGGVSNIVMKFHYPKLRTDFYFPPGLEPVGTAIPWLDRRIGGTPGIPTDMTYQIRWPDEVPELRVGESLVKAKFGLPNIWKQTSVDMIYEQAQAQGSPAGSNVKLIDAAFTYQASLLELPADTAGKTVTNLVGGGIVAPGSVFFSKLPPHLRSRLWWEPAPNNLLRFTGRFVPEFGTEEPVGYLLLNVLTGRDLAEITNKVSSHPTFLGALKALSSQGAANVRLVASNTVQQVSDTFALTAGLANREGYVTVAFNNVVNPPRGLLAGRGAPVDLQIIKVTCPLYRGETKVIYPEDPFDENVTLRHSGDFAGKADGYLFEWQYHQGPGKPAANSPSWLDLTKASGALDVVVGGSGARTLGDWWYRCRWRTTNMANPCGTNFTAYTDPALVEGWIKRVLANINFFNQRYSNLVNSSVDTIVNVISQAGARGLGKVPLNAEALKSSDEFGLIEIYETVLKRGIELSIEGTPGVNDEGANRALLQVSAQLANIYLLLGNEAYADAADPTIGFVTTGVGAGQFGVEATSVHCFMDQAGIDSLLNEELALLRGVDDSFGRNVRGHPIYNRLPPNMGSSFQAEPAYVLNYDIRDRNQSGGIDALDAQKTWPQGHGDAWGHYLTAINNFYRLLRSPNFTWTVTNEFVKLAGGLGDVPVNYQYERKFAGVAAAKARTGAELVNLTYRSRYVENPDGQWQGYLDSNTNRAWGLSEWASRAGQGAYIDWVVGNALLPPGSAGEGIQKVDRTTVTELREINGAFVSIQEELEKADAGLNPLGLAKNVIPFDIDPAKVDAGQTHFEQIYERAVKAMNNAIGVFNHANASTQKLREQAENVDDFQRTVGERENDFNNRLIEVFGYPYPDDPGYAGSPSAPDLYHYMYSDYSDITGEVPPQPVAFTVKIADFTVSPDGGLGRVTNTVTYHATPNGFGLVKPPSWTRPRRAPGEVQMGHSELLQATARFKRASIEYENLLNQIEDQATLLQAQYHLNAEEVIVLSGGQAVQESLNAQIRRSRNRQLNFQSRARKATLVANAISEMFPKTVGFSIDPSFLLRGAVLLAGSVITEIMTQNANSESLAELDHQQAKESAQALQNIRLTTLRQEQSVLQQIAQIEQMVRQEALLRLEIYNQQEAMQQASGRYASTLAKGQRLLEERLRFRQQTAARVQEYRYKDMAFRIFRNEALQQYRAQFDLAATYVYLAASAYDYETNLRDTETRWKSGSSVLTDIVRARSLGVVDASGNPRPGPGPGRKGDGGLAAALWAMNNSWSDAGGNLKGQLGFNNASRENLTFSLRAGLFRALTNDSGHANWRAWLNSYVVPDVAALPEFARYCKPPNEFNLNGRKEPGIVIPFSSAIKFRHNFFGWPETGGGANFSSSYFATKVKSVSARFIGYDAAHLSTTPHVYLVPVGNDVMLSPITQGLSSAPTREWKILDQFMPTPLSITNLSSTFPNPNWVPIGDISQQEPFLAIRRYSQMRAYHDGGLNGTPTNPELEAYKRLIGRSVWNTRWLVVILGGDLLGANPDRGIQTFINGFFSDGEGVGDILLDYSTYSYPGN